MAQPDQESWSEMALAALGEAGHRRGGARQAVVAQLARETCCVTAQEIADRLRSEGSGVGVASVYRALDLLHGIGLVQRIEIGDGGSRYEAVVPGGEHHHHMVCDSCGTIRAFEDETLERTMASLARRLEHRVFAHDVLLHGECERCEQGSGQRSS